MRFHYLVGLLAFERELRRQVPHHLRQGGPPRRAGPDPPGLLCDQARASTAPLKTFEAPALAAARPRAATQPVSAPGRRPELPHPQAARARARARSRPRQHHDLRPRRGGQERQEDATRRLRGGRAGARTRRSQEVDRLSQRYVLSAPEANLAAARKGDMLFYRRGRLAPGRYTLEAVGYDAMSQKASVRTATLEVPRIQDGRVRLSSIVLVGPSGEGRRLGPAAREPAFIRRDHPLPRAWASPSARRLAQPWASSSRSYGGKDAGRPRRRRSRSTRARPARRARSPPTCRLPDATGRIQYAGSLASADLPARLVPSEGHRHRPALASTPSETPFTITE